MRDQANGIVAVEVRRLRKEYGALVAVRDIDLTVHTGDVYGYLGPNGAGKTTSLRMMLGLIRPTSGEARLFGRNPAEVGVRALEGVAGFVEEPTFYPYLSGRANLEHMAALDGGTSADRIDDALDVVGLTTRDAEKVRGYSHGMRQRLGIAAALLREPKLLILDEPTTGLDPAGMRDMRELVGNLARSGLTVLLSSHLMQEVEHLCNRVAIIQRGTIQYEGALDALMARAHQRYRLESTNPTRALGIAQAFPGIADVTTDNAAIGFAADAEAAAAFTVELGRAGIGIYALLPQAQSLEELFLDMTETTRTSPPVETREVAA
ncbi:MAG: type transport system ATP-binding protein [Thermomicrobiales bacterium]|jgi:ABC-2 type transport system ATP-binding protein|nr:type transport system ATP-binding protein [Thermomicrobiales bacterium]MEA2595254.1 type transport system ATP-binding protein [Thermomicrobiales bacterium]